MTRTIEARCIVDIEQTPFSLHAFSPPEDIEIGPGDEMLIHDAPTAVGFNETLRRECRITVRRAGAWRRFWTRRSALFALTELYEVGWGDAG